MEYSCVVIVILFLLVFFLIVFPLHYAVIIMLSNWYFVFSMYYELFTIMMTIGLFDSGLKQIHCCGFRRARLCLNAQAMQTWVLVTERKPGHGYEKGLPILLRHIRADRMFRPQCWFAWLLLSLNWTHR